MVIYYVVIYNTDINIAGNICAAGVTKQPLSQSQIGHWTAIPLALKMPAEWRVI